jgi:hypothetical protein
MENAGQPGRVMESGEWRMENAGQGLAQRRKGAKSRSGEGSMPYAGQIQCSGAAVQRCKDIPRAFARLPEPLPELCAFAPLREADRNCPIA